MTYKCEISNEAKLDYRGIVNYLVSVLGNKQAARDFADEFNSKIALISKNPQLYSLSCLPELKTREYRAVLVRNYVMLYKIDGDKVIIAHIFHQTQNYAYLV